MKRRSVLQLFSGVTLAASFARARAESGYQPPAPSQEVAVTSYDWHDTKRKRDVPVKIYSPKQGAGPWPVIIFSHGLGGSRNGYEYLGRHWAGCGYVSVHVQHIGSDDSVWKGISPTERTRSIQSAAANVSNIINRPADISFTIDQLERFNADEKSALKGKLDLGKLAVAGHSFGGFTSLAVAGQTFQLPPGRSRTFGDPRIKAVVQMSAPAPSNRSNLDAAYDSITLPVMHMTGTLDFLEILPQTTAEDRRIPYDHMHHAETCLVIFNEGDHMIFSGRERMGSPAKLAQDAVFQKLICTGTTAFWEGFLKGSAAARAWVMDGGYKKLLSEQAKFESKRPKG